MSRFAAIGIGIIMSGAILAHYENGFFMNCFGNQKGEGLEFQIIAIGLALVVMIKGAGKWSIDRAFAG